MATDLVLRICQVPEIDGGLPGGNLKPGDPGYDPSVTHIAIQDLMRAFYDILGGYHTVTQIENQLSMTAAQATTFGTFVGLVNSAATTADKIGRVERAYSILLKYERRYQREIPGYTTPDEVEARLAEIDQGF